jgi:hypothetical protein
MVVAEFLDVGWDDAAFARDLVDDGAAGKESRIT